MMQLRLSLTLAVLLLSTWSPIAAAERCVDFDISLGVCTDKQTTETYRVELPESYWRHLNAECTAKGGSLVNGVCENGTEPTEEGQVFPLAQAMATAFYNVCGLTGGLTDTGWGNFQRPFGYGDLCDVPGDGIETQCRWMSFDGREPNSEGCATGQTTSLPAYALRNKRVMCPNGYKEVQTSQGAKCIDIPCAGTCTLNGMQPSSMANQHSQPLFQSPNSSLSITARWSSQGSFEPIGGQTGASSADSHLGWTHDYAKRVYEVVGTPGLLAIAHGPDGRPRHYSPDGYALQAWSEGKDRVERVTDTSGITTGWRIHATNGTTEHYDAQGYLTARTGRGADRLDITLNSDRQVESVVDQHGRSLGFAYDDNGRMSSVTLPDNSTIGMTYGDFNLLEQINWPDGSFRAYRYASDRMLTEVVDENGDVVEKYEYWSAGQIRTKRRAPALNDGLGVDVHSYSNSLWFGYPDNKTSISGPSGSTVEMTFGTVGGVNKLVAQSARSPGTGDRKNISYDANGWPRFSIDFAGNATQYQHDALGLELERIEGATVSGTYTCPTGSSPDASDYGSGCGNGTCWAQSPFEGSLDASLIGWTGWHYSCKTPPSAGSGLRKVQTDWDVGNRLPVEIRVLGPTNVVASKTVLTYNSRGQMATASQVDPLQSTTRTTLYGVDPLRWTR